MMPRKYTLDGRTPVLCDDLLVWGQWMQVANRQVAETAIGDARVSTVFLGLDHQWSDDGPPLLFETMIFGGVYSERQFRCSTWDEAEIQHAAVIEVARAGMH
ncbi:MAG TPA: hypothetical protein VHT52_17995 [Stellaceae bacterium]|jgi:hypothetical protein|nr:hypothetical protein [Stellaceae bacterium]